MYVIMKSSSAMFGSPTAIGYSFVLSEVKKELKKLNEKSRKCHYWYKTIKPLIRNRDHLRI